MAGKDEYYDYLYKSASHAISGYEIEICVTLLTVCMLLLQLSTCLIFSLVFSYMPFYLL